MDDINWLFWAMALGLGIIVGLIVMAAGMWIDHLRDVRWQRELNEGDAPRDIVRQRTSEENDSE